MTTTTTPTVTYRSCAHHFTPWFTPTAHLEYIDRADAPVADDGTFYCSCPYDIEINECITNRVFDDESYHEACMDI